MLIIRSGHIIDIGFYCCEGVFFIIFTAIGMFINDWHDIRTLGYFYGYTPMVYFVVVLRVSVKHNVYPNNCDLVIIRFLLIGFCWSSSWSRR